jgi:hypothetical protein
MQQHGRILEEHQPLHVRLASTPRRSLGSGTQSWNPGVGTQELEPRDSLHVSGFDLRFRIRHETGNMRAVPTKLPTPPSSTPAKFHPLPAPLTFA